jgi:hypothetical protein
MIDKSINGIRYWKVTNINILDTIIQVYLHGFLDSSCLESLKLFTIDVPKTILDNTENYDNLIEKIENWIKDNILEFQI